RTSAPLLERPPVPPRISCLVEGRSSLHRARSRRCFPYPQSNYTYESTWYLRSGATRHERTRVIDVGRGNVLIVGGGIGGLTTAIALRNADYDVHVVELRPDLHSSVSVAGVGIIQPVNALRAGMPGRGLLEHRLGPGARRGRQRDRRNARRYHS